jgi:hypothetical protein
MAGQAACTKSDQPAGGAPSATAETATPPATSAPVAASASAAPPAESASAAASATASASAAAASASAAPSGALANPSGEGECGKSPLPPCPLQGWMKKNMAPPSEAEDAPALATALEKAATFAPPGYTNWVSIAKDGAKAAKAGDVSAAKHSCKSCHEQYKKKYKAELRTRKI